MKKRAKLITTIASLCLAVALMAFGVYAATTASMTITSQISFNVTEVFCRVTGEAYLHDHGDENGHVDLKSYSDQTYTNVSGVKKFKDTTPILANWVIKANSAAAGQDPAWTADPAYTLDNDEIVYVITVINDSSDTMYVTLASDAFPDIEGTTVAGEYKVAAADDLATATATNCVTLKGTGTPAAADNVVDINAAPVPTGEVIQITLKRTLTDFSRAISLTNSLYGALTVSHSNS